MDKVHIMTQSGALNALELKTFLVCDALGLFLYTIALLAFLWLRKWPKLDAKTWGNIIVNLVSFTLKTATWSYINFIYDPAEEDKIGKDKY